MKVIAFLSSAAFVNTLLFTLVSSAPLGSTEGNNEVQSDQIKRDCIPIGVFYDDNSVKVPLEYIGDWTHLSNQGSGVKLGSLSYTGQPNA